MSRVPQVKNRSAAPIQISAEQLIREASERGLEEVQKAPKRFIADEEELIAYQRDKRKNFEDQVRNHRQEMGVWCRYALWEASLKEYDRARSVFERAIEFNYRDEMTWAKYGDMEMKAKFVNHARNVWDRAVTLLPRSDQFWYKFTYMEELVGAIDLTRLVFDRWMKWEPDDNAWSAYIKFEMRQGAIERARGLYEKYILVKPTCKSYVKYAKWEEKQREQGLARSIYERALEELHPAQRNENLYTNFCQFEEQCKEFERVRVIFKFAIDESTLGIEEIARMKKELVAFEKRHGDRQGIEDAILDKRRDHYETILGENKYDYDTWLDYIRLEESEIDTNKIRKIYERAVSCVPLPKEKRYWRRYIYLWVNYALFEELTEKDFIRARAVYKSCLAIIPHKCFTFGKIWLLAAEFEIRQGDVTSARKILGQAIGRCGSFKSSLFRKYIELELQMGEIDRCRSLYAKYLEMSPQNCNAWAEFAGLEINVGESSRARAIYEIAIGQPVLDMPEALWKAYLDFEIDSGTEEEGTTIQQAVQRVCALYNRLLERTGHVKVWLSYALYLAGSLDKENISKQQSIDDNKYRGVLHARAIFEKAYDVLKAQGLKEERVLLLNTWRDVELAATEAGQPGNVADVESKLPRKIKVKKDGQEVYDYVFPDESKKMPGMGILEKAMKWKKAAAESAESAESNSKEVLGKRKLTDEIDIDSV